MHTSLARGFSEPDFIGSPGMMTEWLLAARNTAWFEAMKLVLSQASSVRRIEKAGYIRRYPGSIATFTTLSVARGFLLK